MSSLNKVILLGNLGGDPDVRAMQNGDKVANLSIATSESWKDKDGNKQEKTEWHRVVIFGKIAEIVEKYLKKGSKVLIEGKLQTRKWQDNNGVDKYTTEVIVSGFGGSLKMIGGNNNSGQDSAGSSGGGSDSGSGGGHDDGFEDDVPF